MRLTKPRSRRADILAAAEGEFGTAGFSGARMDRIAAVARVNKQLLFHYFDSKDGLFLAALERLLSRFVPPPPAATPTEQVRNGVAAIQGVARAVPGFVGILADAEANSDFPPTAQARLRQWRAAELERLRAALEDGQRRGFFRDDLDPPGVAAAALAAALGAATVPGTPTLGEFLSDYCAWR
jgi:TetR/AcrR family transcriptional regulator